MILTDGAESAANRALLKCTGIDDFKKPLIGIVTPYHDLLPTAKALKALEEAAKSAVVLAGGTPAVFSVTSFSSDAASGFTGGYNLLQRELTADTVEYAAAVNKYDALLFLHDGSFSVSGMLLGAARVNLPCLFVSTGYHASAVELKTVREGSAKLKDGKLSDTELSEIEDTLPTVAGYSPSQSENTLALLIEALGLSFKDDCKYHAFSHKKTDLIRQNVKTLIKSLKEPIAPRKILGTPAFYNALAVSFSTGGSTNDILTLFALAHECGLELTYKTLSDLSSKTPVLVKNADLSKLAENGGASALLYALVQKALINVNTLTFSGKTLDERVKAYKAQKSDEESIFLPSPETDAVIVLKNNVTDDECLIKKSAVAEELHQFSGLARVYDDEDDAVREMLSGYINDGDVIVIRGIGPKGAPGMREISNAAAALSALGMTKTNAILTDGRVGNYAEGLILVHMSNEAYSGGILAYLKDGDKISIDLVRGRINFDIKDIKMRLKRVITKGNKQTGAAERYRNLVTESDKGAILNVKIKEE
jgi:dihydroxy-acid dehydratase